MSANKISPIFSGGARNILRINLVKTRREGVALRVRAYFYRRYAQNRRSVIKIEGASALINKKYAARPRSYAN
jgi:hypothetical protein